MTGKARKSSTVSHKKPDLAVNATISVDKSYSIIYLGVLKFNR